MTSNAELGETIRTYRGWSCSWRKDNADTPNRTQVFMKLQRQMRKYRDVEWKKGTRHKPIDIAELRQRAAAKHEKDNFQKRHDKLKQA